MDALSATKRIPCPYPITMPISPHVAQENLYRAQNGQHSDL